MSLFYRWRAISMSGSWFGRGRSSTGVRRCHRPILEPMESRRLPSTILEFNVPTANSNPFSIVAGPDGNLWFTELLANKVGVINPTTHIVADFATPTASSNPNFIAAGSDGQLWFTEPTANSIGVINPTTHVITEFPVPTATAGLQGITAGPDGRLWFVELTANQIGAIDPTTHHISEFAIPNAKSGAFGIAAGPDGGLWFTESTADQIGRIDPTTHAIGEFAVPTAAAQPMGIAAGSDGGLWFTEFGGGRIGEINPATHAIGETLISGTAQPFDIAAGPDGGLWFTDVANDFIRSINPVNHVIGADFTPTANASPRGIAAGPDGNLWFVETTGQKVAVLTPAVAPLVTAEPPAMVAPNAPFGLTVTVNYRTGPGLTDAGFNGDVTIALGVNPAGATLGGVATVAAHNGVATFTGLTLDRVGAGFRIVAFVDPRTTTPTTDITVAVPPPSITVSAPPTIVAEAPVFTGKGPRRHVVGFVLHFSAAMDPARAADASGYTLVQFQRRGRQIVSRPVGLRAEYDGAAHAVTLALSGRPKFARGGRLVVAGAPPGGLTDATGVPLDGGNQGIFGDDGTFVIAPKGKGISR